MIDIKLKACSGLTIFASEEDQEPEN